MYSLRRRITRNLTINMVLVMSVLLVVMYFFMQTLLQDYVLTRLQHDTETLIAALEQDSQRHWRVKAERMAGVYSQVRSGHYYRVAAGDRVMLSRSLFDSGFPLPQKPPTIPGSLVLDGPGNEVWLVWVQRVEKQGQSIELMLAEDIEPIREQLLGYSGVALLLVLLVTALLIYLQQRTLRQSFYVFEWLRLNLASIRYRDHHPELPIPAEVEPLVSEIEKLFEHLRQRILRTRHAMGNLAHELKRPIQLLALQLDAQRADDDPAGHGVEPLEEIKSILQRELRRARIAGAPHLEGDFDLARELPYLVEIMSKIHPRIAVETSVDDQPPGSHLDRDDILELTGNLLDNACKFAASRASLTVENDGGNLKLVFEDDGPGLDPGMAEDIRQRGVRLDESVEGHGLGLGICSDIVEGYGGILSFSDAALGGLRVEVVIPLDAGWPASASNQAP